MKRQGMLLVTALAAAFIPLCGTGAEAGGREVYYLAADGNDDADGRTPATAWRTTSKLNDALPAGAEARLRRGDVFYGPVKLKNGPDAQHPTVLTAFGEGPDPEISLYKVAVPKPETWEKIGDNLWQIDLLDGERATGNPVKDGNIGFLLVDGKIHGVKLFGKDVPAHQWEFKDDRRKLQVWSAKNPAEMSSDIRFAPRVGGIQFVRNAEISHVTVRGTGAHGANGVGENMTFRDCTFREIGGSLLYSKGDHYVRYGNGVECWAGSARIVVERCRFLDVYDVAFTMQGPSPKHSWEGVHVRDCEMTRCTQAFEIWTSRCRPGIGMENCSFVRNRCIDTGYCWGYDVRPNKGVSTPLLVYGYESDTCDILVEGNTFINSRLALIFKAGGIGCLPDGYVIRGNTIRNAGARPIGNSGGKASLARAAKILADIQANNTFDPPLPPPPPPPKQILCWGDSVTEGMAMPRGKDYPSQLEALLGPGYIVLNSGDGGENTITIPARQGAVALATAADITFQAGERAVKIGDADDNGLHTPAGEKIKLTAPMGREIPVNPVKIGSDFYKLSCRGFRWNSPTNRISYTLWLTRGKRAVKEQFTIPAGTPVSFASTAAAPNAHCEIFFMGANGGWDNDINKLIAQLRAMVARRGEDKPYLVIVPYWGGFRQEKKDAIKAAFGRHAVEFPVEPKLCYRNRPDVHLNENGYALLAKLLHERGAELGYWPAK